MRQAGRYLPEYQAVRAKADFLTMCRTPDLAAEVTLQPVDIIGVDAAIIFSDILVIPEAMGMALNFHEGRGPVFEAPLRKAKDIDRLRDIEASDDLDYVMRALQLVRKELAGRVPLIGFAGAPWTLAAYMVEGHGSKEFEHIKGMRFGEPGLLHLLLDRLADAVADFLSAQIDAGADVVQLFDSWAGILAPHDFREFSMPYIAKVVQKVRRKGVPVIVFARNAAHSFAELSQSGADALGVSWSEDLAEAKALVGDRVALQGNLDPCALFGPVEMIRKEGVRVLNEGPEVGHIFNLGHGILPKTPVPNAKALVEIVKEESERLTSNR
jgi:uroporphyrinogen decarboxylase